MKHTCSRETSFEHKRTSFASGSAPLPSLSYMEMIDDKTSSEKNQVIL